jgi:hypothetical protein
MAVNQSSTTAAIDDQRKHPDAIPIPRIVQALPAPHGYCPRDGGGRGRYAAEHPFARKGLTQQAGGPFVQFSSADPGLPVLRHTGGSVPSPVLHESARAAPTDPRVGARARGVGRGGGFGREDGETRKGGQARDRTDRRTVSTPGGQRRVAAPSWRCRPADPDGCGVLPPGGDQMCEDQRFPGGRCPRAPRGRQPRRAHSVTSPSLRPAPCGADA